jgi:hypothetical protein
MNLSMGLLGKVKRRINEVTVNLQRLALAKDKLAELACAEYWERAMALERNQDEKRLLKYGYRTYSQNDEDGIIAEIFRRIGTSSRTFIEFGVADGRECNTMNLLIDGWRGLWLERTPQAVASILNTHRNFTEAGQLVIRQAIVTAENIDGIIAGSKLAQEPDLLSIDIDGNDYWVWRAITSVKPRVVVMEYNPLWRPPISVSIKYNPNHLARSDGYFGCSLKALEKLGAAKGYNLVGCCFVGANAFFVRQDLCGDKFKEPFTAENHYEPPRFFMLDHPMTPAFGPGPLETI